MREDSNGDSKTGRPSSRPSTTETRWNVTSMAVTRPCSSRSHPPKRETDGGGRTSTGSGKAETQCSSRIRFWAEPTTTPSATSSAYEGRAEARHGVRPTSWNEPSGRPARYPATGPHTESERRWTFPDPTGGTWMNRTKSIGVDGGETPRTRSRRCGTTTKRHAGSVRPSPMNAGHATSPPAGPTTRKRRARSRQT